MSGSFDPSGRLVIGDGRIVTVVGRKRSGKSILAGTIARSYPGDLVVLDIAGDDGPEGPNVITYRGTSDDFPARWPESQRQGRQPMILRICPDAGSPTHLDDMDAAVGLAMAHGHCGLLVHETGVLAKANQVRPHTRRLLAHNRHSQVTAILCCPRPLDIDPSILGQSDVLYVFRVPQPQDRRRISDVTGSDPALIDRALSELRPHEYLRIDTNADDDDRLYQFPPLPGPVVADTQAWMKGAA